MKPALPKGTRDFGPLETARRRYIFETIRSQFELFGYQALETPAMENLTTLTGKYGDEGDRLIFKILNSGDFLQEVREKHVSLDAPSAVLPLISEKALRYDLTVPFARFVVMNRDKLAFPFKRYQMQPVWRADRPQKGRYREFWQCDADVVGSASLLNEAELIQIYDRVFHQLGLPVNILLNNRKILSGMAEVAGVPEQLTELTVALDKLDKIGWEKVVEEMQQKGIPENALKTIEPITRLAGSNTEKLQQLEHLLQGSEIGLTGIHELRELLSFFSPEGKLELLDASLELDLSLARGLNYYTGTILEVKARNIAFGSIGGGGRYDDLTGLFGLPNVSGVGISFGVDRIYDVLNELNLFPETMADAPKVLITNFGVEEEKYSFTLATKLRAAGINADMYPTQAKLGKQFEYADKKKIPFVAVVGSEEMQTGNITLKDLQTGTQEKYTLEQLIEKLG